MPENKIEQQIRAQAQGVQLSNVLLQEICEAGGGDPNLTAEVMIAVLRESINHLVGMSTLPSAVAVLNELIRDLSHQEAALLVHNTEKAEESDKETLH